MWWWALPTIFYGSLILPMFLLPDKILDKIFDGIGDFVGDNAFSWWTFALFVLLFVVLFAINRSLQMRLIYNEISKNEKTKLKHVSEFQALNRFG